MLKSEEKKTVLTAKDNVYLWMKYVSSVFLFFLDLWFFLFINKKGISKDRWSKLLNVVR